MPAKNLFREHKEGIYSHVYNKGVENRVIFNDEADYSAFLGYLKDYLSAPRDSEHVKRSFTVNGRVFRGTPHQPKNYFGKVELIAYSLMPGHFHLLLHQKASGALASFIRSLCTRYSMYFNKRYQRGGALFQGPYKSVQIKDETRMLYLTHYFHRTSGSSSYAYYLDQKTDSWVSPEVVQSFFAKTKAELGKEADSYRNFVEKYTIGKKAEQLLENITFESEIEHLEGRLPASGPEKQSPKITAKPEKVDHTIHLRPHQRIPEILMAALVFASLIVFSVRNVMISTAKNSTVLSLSNEIKSPVFITDVPNSPTPPAYLLTTINNLNSSTDSAILLATDSARPTLSASKIISLAQPAVLSATEAAKLEMVTIKVKAGIDKVNIRQKPSIASAKIGQAKEGDIFELVSVNSDWYEIKLATSSGFIAAQYMELGEAIK